MIYYILHIDYYRLHVISYIICDHDDVEDDHDLLKILHEIGMCQGPLKVAPPCASLQVRAPMAETR